MGVGQLWGSAGDLSSRGHRADERVGTRGESRGGVTSCFHGWGLNTFPHSRASLTPAEGARGEVQLSTHEFTYLLLINNEDSHLKRLSGQRTAAFTV